MKAILSRALLVSTTLLLATAPEIGAAPLVQRGTRWVELAQADAPRPAADAPARKDADVALRAVITAVRGTVQIRQSEDQQWAPAKPGDVLGAGADIRTGLNSAVQLKIDPGHTVTIDRFSVVRLLTLAKDRDVVTTDVGMKYGRTRYDVEAAGAVHDAKIHTPGTTLAIRGTSTGTQTDAFTESTWVITGVVQNTNKLRREIVQMDASTGKAVVTSDLVTPAAFARNQATNDGKGENTGRTDDDEQLVETYPAGLHDDRELGTRELQHWARLEGFQIPSGDGGGGGGGVFDDIFDLNIVWIPASAGTADVDLIVQDPLGAILNPKGITTVRGGTSTQGTFTSSPIDEQFGLGLGEESIRFSTQVPLGNYLVTVKHLAGDGANVDLTGSLASIPGAFGTENFSIDSDNAQAQFIVNPKDKTITPLDVGNNR